MKALSAKRSLSTEEFNDANTITNRLLKANCLEYGSVKHDVMTVEYERTYLFGKICCIYNNETAVNAYLNYLQNTSGSAEEELSYSFERIFIKNPGLVLSILAKKEKNVQQVLLHNIAWGFLNNHYEENLTLGNYNKIFHKHVTQFDKLYPQYKWQFDILLSIIKAELQ